MAELNPAVSEIETHIRHVIRRWGEIGKPALFELVFLTAHDQAEVRDVRHFEPTEEGVAEAVAHVVAMNKHKLNAYMTVNPVDAMNRPRAGRRASKEHILCSFFHFADADTAEATSRIKAFVGPKYTFFVLTGSTPFGRPHCYWELAEPAFDLADWTATQAAIADTLGTDRVIDPPRIMRLAGTINWPKPQKAAKGYIPEVTSLRIYDPVERPPVPAEQMRRAFTAATPAPVSGPQIDTGAAYAPALDRERMAIQAMSGQDWHNAVIRLVASYVSRGLADAEIHALTDPLTLTGYTVDDTRREVQTAIDGARRKGWTPVEYANPAQIRPPEQAAPEPSFDAPARPATVEWFDDIQPALDSRYLVKGVLDAGAMSVIYGPSNSGKSFFAMDLGYHIAIGAPWRGRRVGQASVLYLAAEGGNGIANRIVALRQEHGVCDVPFALKRAGMDLLHDQADLQHIVDLAGAVGGAAPERPLMIVIDTLSRIMAGGDENNAADMTALIRNIDAIRAATGAHVMLVHHTGKDAARGARGHSSLRAATDTEIEVANDNGARAALVTKQRDHQGGETFAFALRSVTLGQDGDGDDVTSCVLEVEQDEGAQRGRNARRGIGGNQKIIADTFDQMLAEGMGKPNHGGVGMPEPGTFWTVPMDDLRAYSQGKMAASNKRGAFIEAWKSLSEGRGLFCAASEIVWAVDRKVK